MKYAWTSVLLLSLALVAVPSFATDCHTGSDITIHLTSPSAPGTYATPTRFTATASSSKTITGYVVYENAGGSYVNAYQNVKTTLDAWVVLPLTSAGGPQAQNVFVSSLGTQADSAATAQSGPRHRLWDACPHSSRRRHRLQQCG